MVIFLYGQDNYRLKQNSYVVLDNYRKKHPNGVFLKFDFTDGAEVNKVEDAAKSNSFFGEVRLIILRNVFSQKTDSGRMGEMIKNRGLLKEKDTILMFLENKDSKELLAKDKILFNLLNEKDSVVRNFEYLQGEKLSKWIKSEVVLRKCSIESAAVAELINLTGNESWALVNEINKLCNFKTEGVIKKEDVALLGFKKTDLNIFDFVDAVAGKNKNRAYEILFKEVQSGRDPYYLLTMVVYGFRNLLAVRDLSGRGMALDAIVKKARLHPFVARKTCQSARKFDPEELKSIYRHLLNLDTRYKEGNANLVDSLFNLVLA